MTDANHALPAASACLNCGAAFTPARRPYCPECGQETRVQAPTLREFAQQFGGAYLSTEGALWRTLKLLLFTPGELTRRYLGGQRRHYVLPLRLYLTLSVMTLLLLRLTAGDVDRSLPFDPDLSQGEISLIRWNNDTTGPMIKDGVFICSGVPDWVCKRLARRFETDAKGLQRQVAELRQRALSSLGAAMFVMLPLFAAALKLAYLNRRLRYTEHLVFALHLHSFWFLMAAVMLCRQPLLTGLAAMAVPVYALLAMKRVYGGRWSVRLLRAGLLSAFYGVALVIAMLGVAIWSLLA